MLERIEMETSRIEKEQESKGFSRSKLFHIVLSGIIMTALVLSFFTISTHHLGSQRNDVYTNEVTFITFETNLTTLEFYEGVYTMLIYDDYEQMDVYTEHHREVMGQIGPLSIEEIIERYQDINVFLLLGSADMVEGNIFALESAVLINTGLLIVFQISLLIIFVKLVMNIVTAKEERHIKGLLTIASGFGILLIVTFTDLVNINNTVGFGILTSVILVSVTLVVYTIKPYFIEHNIVNDKKPLILYLIKTGLSVVVLVLLTGTVLRMTFFTEENEYVANTSTLDLPAFLQASEGDIVLRSAGSWLTAINHNNQLYEDNGTMQARVEHHSPHSLFFIDVFNNNEEQINVMLLLYYSSLLMLIAGTVYVVLSFIDGKAIYRITAASIILIGIFSSLTNASIIANKYNLKTEEMGVHLKIGVSYTLVIAGVILLFEVIAGNFIQKKLEHK